MSDATSPDATGPEPSSSPSSSPGSAPPAAAGPSGSSGSSGPTGPSGVPGTQAAERLLAEVRTEIGRADTKASVLVGALGACAGVVLGAYWGRMPATGVSRFAGVAGALAWALALGCLLFATAPRYRASRWREGSPLTYFLDVRRAASSGVLADALRSTEEQQLAGLATALRNTSEIAAAKHRWIRAGLGCFVLGAVALGVSALTAL
ncbi:Pycsar system effector family protein [Streptomyces sp. NPDC015131]|uniref:Pycsar system effector family protein n=1 Tax=Streptomyces sp. NPDC015131 TaxID=3364941 RepID=UPI0036FA436F